MANDHTYCLPIVENEVATKSTFNKIKQQINPQNYTTSSETISKNEIDQSENKNFNMIDDFLAENEKSILSERLNMSDMCILHLVENKEENYQNPPQPILQGKAESTDLFTEKELHDLGKFLQEKLQKSNLRRFDKFFGETSKISCDYDDYFPYNSDDTSSEIDESNESDRSRTLTASEDSKTSIFSDSFLGFEKDRFPSNTNNDFEMKEIEDFGPKAQLETNITQRNQELKNIMDFINQESKLDEISPKTTNSDLIDGFDVNSSNSYQKRNIPSPIIRLIAQDRIQSLIPGQSLALKQNATKWATTRKMNK